MFYKMMACVSAMSANQQIELDQSRCGSHESLCQFSLEASYLFALFICSLVLWCLLRVLVSICEELNMEWSEQG